MKPVGGKSLSNGKKVVDLYKDIAKKLFIDGEVGNWEEKDVNTILHTAIKNCIAA